MSLGLHLPVRAAGRMVGRMVDESPWLLGEGGRGHVMLRVYNWNSPAACLEHQRINIP